MRNVNTAFILGTFMFRSNITFSTLIQTNCQFEISQHSSRPGDKADKTKKAPTARLQENNYKKVPDYSISLYIQSKISQNFLRLFWLYINAILTKSISRWNCQFWFNQNSTPLLLDFFSSISRHDICEFLRYFHFWFWRGRASKRARKRQIFGPLFKFD